MGMAQSMWPYIVNRYTTCEIRISGDGTVDAFCGTQDIGTGTRTVFAQVVAEELGLQAGRHQSSCRRLTLSARPSVRR